MQQNHRQTIRNGDNNVQVAGDINIICLTKNLAPAIDTIRSEIQEQNMLQIDDDKQGTVLVQKLTKGGFNVYFIDNAIRSKLKTFAIVLDFSKTEKGKNVLNDIYENLLSIINLKYISQLSEGESLKTSMSSLIEDLSGLCVKYSNLVTIDEAFLEGLLYIATSKCALKWRVGDEEHTDNC